MSTLRIFFTGLFVALLFHLSAQAQENDSSRVWRSGFYVSNLVQVLDHSDLNDQLLQAGLAELPAAMIGISMGFTNRHRDQNSYGLTQFSWLSAYDDQEDESRETELNLWKFSFGGQYDLIGNPKWLGYPYLRLGISLARLKVAIIDITTTFRNSVSSLSSPDYAQKKYTGGVLLNGELGLGIERQFSIPGTLGFVGLSAGYELSPGVDWRRQDVDYYLPNSPTFRTNGWVFELRLRVEYDPTTVREEPTEPRGLFRFFQ